MGNKTVKRVGILLGISVLLGGTSFAFWRFQVERMAHDVVARAEKAEEEGNYARAAELYREHLTVKPSDVEVKLKYADVLAKSDWAARQPELALEIYEDLVGQFPGREDVRRRAAEVAAELATRSGGSLFERARGHLAILLKTAPNDGHLEFLMGRCYEEDKEYDLAAKSYGSAIEHDAPERIEAARRRAMLLDKPGADGRGRSGHQCNGRVRLRRLSRLPGTRTIPQPTRPAGARRRRPQDAENGPRPGPGLARLLPGRRRRFPQGAATGPPAARGLPGSRRRGRARVGVRRGAAGAGQGPGGGAGGRRALSANSPPSS